MNNAGIPTSGFGAEDVRRHRVPTTGKAHAPQPRRGAARHPRVRRRDGRCGVGPDRDDRVRRRAARASACRRSTARPRRARWDSSRGLAAEVGAHGVTANCVSLGTMKTGAARGGARRPNPELEQRLARPYPVPRVGEPGDPAAARGPPVQRRRRAGSPARCIRSTAATSPPCSLWNARTREGLQMTPVAGGAGVTFGAMATRRRSKSSRAGGQTGIGSGPRGVAASRSGPRGATTVNEQLRATASTRSRSLLGVFGVLAAARRSSPISSGPFGRAHRRTARRPVLGGGRFLVPIALAGRRARVLVVQRRRATTKTKTTRAARARAALRPRARRSSCLAVVGADPPRPRQATHGSLDR